MSFVIRSSNGQRTVIPTTTKRQVDSASIRADLVEALKGLTIKFELKISDVVAGDNAVSEKVATCNGIHDQSEFSLDKNFSDNYASTSSSAIPTINGHSVNLDSPAAQVNKYDIAAAFKAICDEVNMNYSPPAPQKAEPKNVNVGNVRSVTETKPPLQDATSERPQQQQQPSSHQEEAIDDNNENMHPNLRPILVNEFRSSIRPASSLNSDSTTDRPRAKMNFTPLQVLQKQAENQVARPQARNGTRRPTFVDPIGDNSFPRRPITPAGRSPTMSASPPQRNERKYGQTNGLHKEPQASNGNPFESPINEPPRMSSSQNKVNENAPVKPATPPTVIKPVAESAREPVKPAIKWGKPKIGSTIKTCFLSDDTKTNPPITYITYDGDKLLEVTEMLCELASEIDILPKQRSVSVHDLVFAKSAEDGSWYRAQVGEVKGTKVDVYYLDWGLTETVDIDQVRYLSDSRLSLATQPACGLKAKFTNGSSFDLEDLFLREFYVKVESYDEFDDIYTVTVMR